MFKFAVCILTFVLVLNSFCVYISAEETINISAKSAIVICGDTGEVLYAKSERQKLPMASTTKIMTALILAEQPDLSKTITVTEQMVAVEGSSMGLLSGDSVSYRDLLYGMLLASGNDAANATAYALGGSIKGFAHIMNQKAKEIGMMDTSFVTPSGLDDENHYTTAYDLALLTSVALKNTAFRTACSSKNAVLYYGNPPYKRSLSNHNKLLGNYDGLIGVKTGFTKKSGRCLVTAVQSDGKFVISVTLNAPDDWNDHRKMLDFGLASIVVKKQSNNVLSDILPIVGSDADCIRIASEEVTFSVAQKNENQIKKIVMLPRFVFAPISAGEIVGRVEYRLNDQVIKVSKIYSVADAYVINKKENFIVRFLRSIKEIWDFS